MKWLLCFLLVIGSFSIKTVEARQYDEGFLIELIESGNPEAVNNFFVFHDDLVSKTKRLSLNYHNYYHSYL